MNKLIIVILILSNTLYCQSSFDRFFEIELNKTNKEMIKQIFTGKIFSDNEANGLKGISFIDTLSTVKAKILFMFSTSEKLIGKAISNEDKKNKDAEILFGLLKRITINKFGNKYNESSVAGMKKNSWQLNGTLINLIIMKDLCIYSITKVKK